jgi:hypothetical protein|tara:strand:+ start:417 stop:575 length:159 start_codon:yes stop_codon:yes gene_type:complete
MLSREYLIKQGSCCGEGCLMCPYEPENEKGATEVRITVSNLSSGFYKKHDKE